MILMVRTLELYENLRCLGERVRVSWPAAFRNEMLALTATAMLLWKLVATANAKSARVQWVPPCTAFRCSSQVAILARSLPLETSGD